MSTSKSKTGAFLTGTVIGSLVGATVALLYAPNSGEETRTVIKTKSIEIKDKAVEGGEEILHKAEEVAAQTRTRFEETASATRERALGWQQRGMEFLDEQRVRFQEAIESGKSKQEAPDKMMTEQAVEEVKEEVVEKAKAKS